MFLVTNDWGQESRENFWIAGFDLIFGDLVAQKAQKNESLQLPSGGIASRRR